MPQRLKIASIVSQIAPFSKTGGLGDVAASLPKALHALGHQVISITPLYGKIIDPRRFNLRLIFKNIPIVLAKNRGTKVNYWRRELGPRLPVYFIENKKYFPCRQRLYGPPHQANRRFFLFNAAALKLLALLKFQPDIIQCHEWHAGLIPYLIKKNFSHNALFKKTAAVFTIHNLSYQFGYDWRMAPRRFRDDGRQDLPGFFTKKFEYVNFAKRAILESDVINTVSEQYAREILTKNFGEDLHLILQNRREKLFGIINGIDYHDYNPETDPGLVKNYNSRSFAQGKAENKKALQKYFKLPLRNVPLLAMMTRFAEHKGLDMLLSIMEPLLRQDIQLVILGAGEKKYENFFKKTAQLNPKKFKATLKFEREKTTLAYAGADITLMPSRFEPCGLTQLISMHYGAVPVVRATGGLSDTVSDFDHQSGQGNGFTFHKYNPYDFFGAIANALFTYQYKDVWQNLVRQAMEQSSSWELPAQKYVKLFYKAIRLKSKD